MAVKLGGFTAEAVDEESARLGVSVEQLISFSVLYYLADVDSGRIDQRSVKGPHTAKDLRPESLHVS